MKKIIPFIFISISLLSSDYSQNISLMVGNSENGYSQNLNRSTAFQLQYRYDNVRAILQKLFNEKEPKSAIPLKK